MLLPGLSSEAGAAPDLKVEIIAVAGRPTGTRVVSFTATDSGGLVGQAFLTIDYSNAGPRLVLVQPGEGATLYSGLHYAFRAELHDDTVKLDLPLTDCTGVTWSSANPADPAPLAKGCTPTVRFGSAGTRTVTVGDTDAYGVTGSEHVTATVFEPGGEGQYIRIVDVFPERKHDGTSGGYRLHLTVSDPARPGSISGTAVHIAFLPALK